MPLEIDIAMITPRDMEDVAEVLLRSMEPDLIDRFFVPFEGFEEAAAAKKEWTRQTFPKSIVNPNKRLFKAMLKGTSKIVGYAGIAYSDGVFEDEKQESKGASDQQSASQKEDFATFYFSSMSAIHRKHMQGQKHVVWNSLHVRPQYQKQGVGSALLRWGFEKFDLEKEKVWIQTQMRGRNVYRRYGWVDVEHLDVDLSEWGGKMRGFGMHRSPCMLRQPGKFERIEGIVNE